MLCKHMCRRTAGPGDFGASKKAVFGKVLLMFLLHYLWGSCSLLLKETLIDSKHWNSTISKIEEFNLKLISNSKPSKGKHSSPSPSSSVNENDKEKFEFKPFIWLKAFSLIASHRNHEERWEASPWRIRVGRWRMLEQLVIISLGTLESRSQRRFVNVGTVEFRAPSGFRTRVVLSTLAAAPQRKNGNKSLNLSVAASRSHTRNL